MSPFSNSLLAIASVAPFLWGCGSSAISPGPPPLTVGIADYAVPVKSMLARRYLTVIRQQYDYSCGSAALASLLRFHYEIPVDERIVFQGMWQTGDQAKIRQLGFSLLDMKRYLEANRVNAEGYQVTLDDIATTRIPGIALIDLKGYKHFVVVKGVDDRQVLVGDPSRGMRRMDREHFADVWNGVLFAIADQAPRGKASFGRRSEWALAMGGPKTAAMEPVSLQALSLVRAPPFPIEL